MAYCNVYSRAILKITTTSLSKWSYADSKIMSSRQKKNLAGTENRTHYIGGTGNRTQADTATTCRHTTRPCHRYVLIEDFTI